MKKILSIDGGGMKGLIPATVLCELESRLQTRCAWHFDLVAGTSIGGILACLIGMGKCAKEAMGFFTEDGPEIFGRQQFGGWNGLLRPRYSAAGIEGVLKARMRNQDVSGVAAATPYRDGRLVGASPPKILVTAYDLEADEDVIFKSWEANPFLMWEVARATSAAQTYFPAFELKDPRFNITRVLWDGGVVANNPATLACAAAMKLWPGEELCVLSVGCGGTRSGGIATKMINAGLFQAAARTLSVLFETNDEVPGHILAQVVPKYVRIQPAGHNLPMDDASPLGIRRLEDAAYQCVEESGEKLEQYVRNSGARI